MRDLTTDPACREEDLGVPLPDSTHAVSVAMPLWEHVIGYEEERPSILRKLQCGYPRFFVHPVVRELFVAAEMKFARAGERCVVFPDRRIARRCVRFLEKRGVGGSRVVAYGWGQLAAVLMPEEGVRVALEFWRYSGEIISSRQAEAALAGIPGDGGEQSRLLIRERLAELAGQPVENVFLFGTGMAATFAAHRMLDELLPGLKSLQLEFPYVDVLKVQTHFGSGERFFPVVNSGEWEDVWRLIENEQLCGVFCELPSNPMMRSVDLEGLAPKLRKRQVPLVIDDTIATVVNADVYQYADLVTTSLTKYFSGQGDVMGGVVVVNRDSEYAGVFRAWLESQGETVWGGDAEVMEEASRDFVGRMGAINRNGEALSETLAKHPKIERVYYPKYDTPELYGQIRREGGGFGGLLSVVLKGGEREAAGFYNRLAVSKGPSFGMKFTLACPYTLLAHYHELDWAAKCGVDRNLVRIGAGAEDCDELVARFVRALESGV